MRKSFYMAFAILMLFVSCGRESMLTIHGKTMGTLYTVKIQAAGLKEDESRIRGTIDTALADVNRCMNTYDTESEISQFNQFQGNDIFSASEEFLLVTRMAFDIYARSGGAFDPTVRNLVGLWGFGDNGIYKKPALTNLQSALQHVGMDKISLENGALTKTDPMTQLDYSAIAKGYGVDKVMDALASLGYQNILVEIGGEIRVKGQHAGQAWRIGIAVPSDDNVGNQRAVDMISLKDKACATSGDYQQFYIEDGERYTHLIDPKSGYPIKHEVISVTVIADHCMLADAVATASIVLGNDKGLSFIEEMNGVEAYFIYLEGDSLKSVQSSGWSKTI